jgi:hypothetical protein
MAMLGVLSHDGICRITMSRAMLQSIQQSSREEVVYNTVSQSLLKSVLLT